MKKSRKTLDVIKGVHVTEKANTLQSLKENEANKSIRKFDLQKIVFKVDIRATKPMIKEAVEDLFHDQKAEVLKVNTIRLPSKKRRIRGFLKYGKTQKLKKAVVTLKSGSEIDLES